MAAYHWLFHSYSVIIDQVESIYMNIYMLPWLIWDSVCYSLNLSMISKAKCNTAVTPLLKDWSYCSLTLSHQLSRPCLQHSIHLIGAQQDSRWICHATATKPVSSQIFRRNPRKNVLNNWQKYQLNTFIAIVCMFALSPFRGRTRLVVQTGALCKWNDIFITKSTSNSVWRWASPNPADRLV